jgi:hypothetical protein
MNDIKMAYEQFGLSLKKMGNKYRCTCPFHKENDASFVIYEDGSYHCFGCKATGTFTQFAAHLTGDAGADQRYAKCMEDVVLDTSSPVYKYLQKMEKELFVFAETKTFEEKDYIWRQYDLVCSTIPFMVLGGVDIIDILIYVKKNLPKLK